MGRIITDNDTLRLEYSKLARGDSFIGRLRLKQTEEYLLVDLLSRGVHVFPSALSQHASRSKTFQAQLFLEFMPPLTVAVHDQHDLLEAIGKYQCAGVVQVVTKLDRKNAGMGIFLWHSVEDVFTQASLGVLPFPFVLQPFFPGARDIRILILGDYVEAYWRENPHGFRNNLHCGGRSEECVPDSFQMDLSRAVMERGGFPYAHLDLLVTREGKTFLAEINLRGGIRGAKITPQEYQECLRVMHDQETARIRSKE